MASQMETSEDPSRVRCHRRVLQRITSATGELEKGVKRVGTQDDGIELREDLNAKKDAVVADIQTMKNILQSTKARAEDDKSRTLNMRYDKLTKDFKAVVAKAEAALRQYERKFKEHPLRREFSTSDTLTSSLTMQGSGPDTQQQEVAMDTAVALAERNQQLRQLHGNIEDLHDIGKNIAVMVEDQQTAVDHIEVNVDQAADRVTRGASDLKQGSILAHKKRVLTAVIVAILVGVAVGVVLLVIIIGTAVGCSNNSC